MEVTDFFQLLYISLFRKLLPIEWTELDRNEQQKEEKALATRPHAGHWNLMGTWGNEQAEKGLTAASDRRAQWSNKTRPGQGVGWFFFFFQT